MSYARQIPVHDASYDKHPYARNTRAKKARNVGMNMGMPLLFWHNGYNVKPFVSQCNNLHIGYNDASSEKRRYDRHIL